MKQEKNNAMVRIAALLCCALLSVSAWAQTFTVQYVNKTAEQVIRDLRQKTNYEFVYQKQVIEGLPNLTIGANNRSLEELLDIIFVQGFGLEYEIVQQSVVLRRGDSRREYEFSGRVMDDNGEPLTGATVYVRETRQGMVTDADGNFTIKARRGQTLAFSYLGYETKEMKYTGFNNVTIMLTFDSKNMLSEVVTTGYQTIHRRQLTSSVTSLQMDDIAKPGVTSLDQMLEGQVPDMMFINNSGEVGSVPRLRIRGTSTLIGNREPLWVLDGVVLQDPVNVSPEELNNLDYINRVGNAIAGINPQDIERIDVLKDASATALYGAKAANGVIVVTTKKGHEGKPIVSYNTNVSFKSRPRYTDSNINLMNSAERIEFSRYLLNNGYLYSSGTNMVGYEGLAAQYYGGQISYDVFAQEVNRLAGVNTDWFDLLTHDAVSHTHTVSLAGGSERVRYYASVGYSNEDDVIKNTNNERYTYNMNISAQLNSRISVQLGANGNVNNREYVMESIAPLNYAYNTSRAIPAYDEDGEYTYISRSSGVYSRSGLMSYNYNVLNEIENSSNTQEGITNNLALTLDGKITDWLKAKVIGSYQISDTHQEQWWGERSFHAATLRTSDFGVAPLSGPDSESTMPFGGELTRNDYRSRYWMLRAQLDLNKNFGTGLNHNISATLGYEASSAKYMGESMVNRGYFRDRGRQFTQTVLSDYPYYQNWLEQNAYPTITDNLTNLLSAYASVSYSYKQLFTVMANARIDGSNKFGDRSNEKLLPIWSVSGNYTLSEHEWLRRDWIDFVMLKASYGYQGNMLDGQSPQMIVRQHPTDALFNELISQVAVYPNPNLQWEKTETFNTGLSFSLFKRRLQIEAEYYHKQTTDAFLTKRVSTVNGVKEYVVNSGNITNDGYSIMLTAVPVRFRDFNWVLSTSFSQTRNELTSQPGKDQYELSDYLNGRALIMGKPIGTFYSYEFAGLDPDNGTVKFNDWEDRKDELAGLTKYDVFTSVLKDTGSREPTISGNINNTLTYKNWRINAVLTYSLGSKVRLFQLYRSFAPESNINRQWLNHWSKPGDELTTDIPNPLDNGIHWSARENDIPTLGSSIGDMYNQTDIRVVSGNYLKCQTLSLTYEFDKAMLDRMKLSRLALSLSGANLFTICSSRLNGQTPQQSGFNNVQLTDRPAYTLGLNISF